MKQLYLTLFSIFLTLFLAGCGNSKPAGEGVLSGEEYQVHYAKGFKVKKYTGYTEVAVINPWDTTKLLQKYILVDREKDIPADLPAGTVVKVPVKGVAAYNTLQCATLKELDNASIIKGVFEPQYVKLEDIVKGIQNGSITDLGDASKPDIEKLIMLAPEAILASPISGMSYGNIDKTKIPVIEIPDYTEPDPLGRAEWIRFYSLFIGKEQQADSLFDVTVKNYNEIKQAVQNAATKPSAFTDTKYQNNWNMPGGKSYMANMLADAGAAYIWADDNSTTFLPLSFEAVLDKAGEADVWIIKYNSPEDLTYASLEKEFKQYSYFKAFKQKSIYGCNTSYSAYFEDMAIHPDYILKDFAAIFHPELFTGYELRYHKRLR
ncbi:iron complex transport system substrate-binding protein [Dysgonomonas sp. PFB1-18]|uniref:ABC transporter substrate-binding protein n=1 Tax=unclassified Dysgonomonas TaxID=2630389 RepID=UPI0024763DC3|nr:MULTISPECIES: ABC transporter substrate-binding protein [unclassified Dysgonomonas]MDH6309098.1 iron complex transport system substrate-binding protein [Dysgonomonas sp. PF1-14]MDH6339022.1 iron complex transport system substrate-binding protein [Dysgonomonas sp. PF1-16]MDH6380347.1 iron complex transport system substrate-binding protein [Dysgonomonas sp. PFB1-18]MDH6397850.1 iron complex transport system substrate-binding protein [Dysgonomonas sp. PF1-23]